MGFLTINQLTKFYPGQNSEAVNGVSFELNQGEIIAVVGENGSGKTTLLKLINGMEDASSGEISFLEERVKGPSFNLVPGHQQIRMLFQEYNLFPRHTIKENILYNIRMLSHEDQNNILDDLLDLCQLKGLEDKLPQELSGGQQQRVALAKAVADSPLLLLLDEPFSNLDLFLKDEIKKNVVKKIKKDGNSAVFVTHDLKDALGLADRIAVMRSGTLLQLDTPQNVYEKPVDEYVAYLFGHANILEVKNLVKDFDLADHKKFSSSTAKSKAFVRPEHFAITKETKSKTSGIVKDVTYLGDSYELEVKTKNLSLRVNTRKKKIEIGDKIYLKISPSKVHLL